MAELFAVKYRDRWRIARPVPAETYGEAARHADGRDVWSDDQTTGWICPVGEEDRVVALDE